MTAHQVPMEPQPRRLNRRWLALYLVLALWVLSRALLSNVSERLRELPAGTFPVASRDGMLLLLTGPGSPGSIHGVPAHHGARRLLVPRPSIGANVQATWPTPTGAIFRTDEPAGPPSARAGTQPWWSFGAGERRARLWTARLDGSPARELLGELRKESPVPSGGACFWLRPNAPTRKAEPPDPSRTRSLMMTPLEGGPSREICTGLNALTWLEPVGGGVSWAVFQPGSPRMDRYVALPPSFDVALLEDCLGRPELLNGRLYWLHSTPERPGSGEPRRLELTTASVDGQDRKVIADLLNSPDWAPVGRLLGAHRGRAYCLLTRRPRQNKPGLPTLCEVNETQVTPIATLQHDAWPTWFGDGYLYYTRMESRENWLNCTSANSSLRTVRVLYRIRLPAD